MNQIASNEQFPIVYKLDDPNDTNTYYVQAKVYNGADNTVLATINLTDQGSNLFTNFWKAVADNSGLGRWIYILSTVYTDSAYTVKSTRYGIQSDTYLIQNRMNPNLGYAAGGGYQDVKIDEKTLRKSVEILIRQIIKEEIPSLVDNTKSNRAMIRELTAEIINSRVKIPDPTDVSGLLAQKEAAKMLGDHFVGVSKMVSEQSSKTNEIISAVTSQVISEFDRKIKTAVSEISSSFQSVISSVEGISEKSRESISNQVADMIEKSFNNIKFEVGVPQPKIAREPKKTIDFDKIKSDLRSGKTRDEILNET